MKTIPGYLSKTEAANTLGIARQTLDRYITKHKIPTFRFLGNPVIYVQEHDIKNLFNPIRKAN
jgi:predicted site-specific integrase-resolvase